MANEEHVSLDKTKGIKDAVSVHFSLSSRTNTESDFQIPSLWLNGNSENSTTSESSNINNHSSIMEETDVKTDRAETIPDNFVDLFDKNETEGSSGRNNLETSSSSKSEPNLYHNKRHGDTTCLNSDAVEFNKERDALIRSSKKHTGSDPHVHKTTASTLLSAKTPSQKTVHLQEVAPSMTSILDARAAQSESSNWKFPLDWFSSQKRGKQKEDKKLPRRVRDYYKEQDELISLFEGIRHSGVEGHHDDEETAAGVRKRASFLTKLTFGLNLLLLIAKLVAAILSGSLSIISSLVDSAVDLISGIIIWWTARAIKKRDPYVYPEGRTKLEPLGIVVLSVVMSIASVQLIVESAQKIIEFAKGETTNRPVVNVATIVIISFTVVTKFILWLLCRRVKSPSTQVLALDHRNDVLSNSVALLMGFIGSQFWEYADPLGAILISMYIAFSWYRQGWAQIKLLTGYTARPEFLKKITWICLDHSSKIQQIDTVRAFHFGTNFIVEVDIVLPETMTLKEAHDIGEPLQQKLEKLPEVERAFVHLDYEFEHSPHDEHKSV